MSNHILPLSIPEQAVGLISKMPKPLFINDVLFIVYCLLNGSPLADAEAAASLPGVHIGAYNIKHREYIHYKTLYKR